MSSNNYGVRIPSKKFACFLAKEVSTWEFNNPSVFLWEDVRADKKETVPDFPQDYSDAPRLDGHEVLATLFQLLPKRKVSGYDFGNGLFGLCFHLDKVNRYVFYHAAPSKQVRKVVLPSIADFASVPSR